MFDAPRGEAFPAVLDPLEFFVGRTDGCAVVRTFTGRIARRCTIQTQGSPSAEFGALHFDEIYTYDDGSPEDRMRWAVVRDRRGGLEATEESVTAPVQSVLRGPQWRVRFRRRARPPASGPVLLYDARFSLVRPDTVMKVVTVSLLGVPLAVLSGFHRRV
jgi:hypothetical protein